MSTYAASRLSQGQLLGFEQALEAVKTDIEESWKSDEHKADVARNLESVIQQTLPILKSLDNLWRSSLELIEAHRIDDYNELGRALRASFDPGLRIMARVVELVTAFERVGGTIASADELRDAHARLLRMENGIFEHWPLFTEQDAAEAREAIERGDYLELDDAFAQIAGVDKETWMRRVEARRRALFS